MYDDEIEQTQDDSYPLPVESEKPCKVSGERNIAGEQKTIITFSKNDDYATVYASTPRIIERLDSLCQTCESHYKPLKTRLNSKGSVASKDYAVSVGMLGFMTPVDSSAPATTAGKGGRQRKAKQ